MKDFEIENMVYDRIYKKLQAEFEKINVVSEYTSSFAEFPAVTFYQASKSVDTSRITDEVENTVTLMFEVRVYSNKTSGKKTEAKKIMSVIDDEMVEMNMVCTMCQPISNLADEKIYQLLARYTCKVEAEKNGDNTTYRIYAK